VEMAEPLENVRIYRQKQGEEDKQLDQLNLY